MGKPPALEVNLEELAGVLERAKGALSADDHAKLTRAMAALASTTQIVAELIAQLQGNKTWTQQLPDWIASHVRMVSKSGQRWSRSQGVHRLSEASDARATPPGILIVDGHPSHRANAVKGYVDSLEGRLKLFFLPPYSPELNPDELVWNDVKNNAVGRAKLEGPKDMHCAVVSRLRFLQMRPDRVRSFFRTPETCYAAA